MLNRPLNYIDPTGHADQAPDDGGIGDSWARTKHDILSRWNRFKGDIKRGVEKVASGACDLLGSGGTLCMGHLLNVKPVWAFSVEVSGSSLVASKSSDDDSESSSSGGGGGGDTKQKKSIRKRLLTAIGDVTERRVTLRKATKQAILDAAPKNSDGDFIDPNTLEVIPKNGPFDFGHKREYKWRDTQQRARIEGWTRKELIEFENNPTHFQIETPSSNRSRRFDVP